MRQSIQWAWKRISGIFLAGVLVLLPVVVTAGIVVWVVEFFAGVLGPGSLIGGLLEGLGLTVKPGSNAPYVVGWIVVLAVIFLLGAVVEAGARRALLRLADLLFSRIPLIGSLYGTTKQVVDLFDHRDSEAIKGMTPVFCSFGERQSAAFLAFLVSPETVLVGGREHQMVIVPTAPVPFGGGLLFVPVEQVVPAGMSVDAMMSVYLSMGVSLPEHLRSRPKPGVDGPQAASGR